MFPPAKQYVLSFSDFKHALQEQSRTLRVLFIIGLCIAALWLVTRPVTYTAHGVFKGKNPAVAAAALLNPKLVYPTENADGALLAGLPPHFLNSYPVMQRVCRELRLQATVYEKSPQGSLRNAVNRVHAQWACWQVHTLKGYTPLLNKHIPLAPKPLSVPPPCTLRCTHVIYTPTHFTQLKLHFKKNNTFEVFCGHKKWGEGRCGVPFRGPWGEFTLEDTPHSGRRGRVFHLVLLPEEACIHALQQTLKIVPDKKNGMLHHLYVRHTHPQWAQDIINATQTAFQIYAAEEYASKHLQAARRLQEKTQDVAATLDTLQTVQKERLESLLEHHSVANMQARLSAFQKKQEANSAQTHALEEEILSTYRVLKNDPTATWAQLLEEVNTWEVAPGCSTDTLTLLRQKMSLLEETRTLQLREHSRYVLCLDQLHTPGLEGIYAAKMLQEASCAPCLQRCFDIQYKLADVLHWSAKERTLLEETLQSEKAFLIEHLEQSLQALTTRMAQNAQERSALQKTLLKNLVQSHEQCQKARAALEIERAAMTQAWLQDQELHFQAEQTREGLKTLQAQMLVKEQSLALFQSLSPLFQPATLPPLPDSPHLLWGSLLGGLLLAAVGGLILCLYEFCKGPRATARNLTDLGYAVCGSFFAADKQRDRLTIKNVLLSLLCQPSPHAFLLGGATLEPLFLKELTQGFANVDRRLLVVDCQNTTEEGLYALLQQRTHTLPLKRGEGYDVLPLGTGLLSLEELLFHPRLPHVLTLLQEQYPALCWWLEAPLDSLQMHAGMRLATTHILCLRHERLHTQLPEGARYVLFPRTTPTYTLPSLAPLLKKLSALCGVWGVGRLVGK